jgi:hypothetical protein
MKLSHYHRHKKLRESAPPLSPTYSRQRPIYIYYKKDENLYETPYILCLFLEYKHRVMQQVISVSYCAAVYFARKAVIHEVYKLLVIVLQSR